MIRQKAPSLILREHGRGRVDRYVEMGHDLVHLLLLPRDDSTISSGSDLVARSAAAFDCTFYDDLFGIILRFKRHRTAVAKSESDDRSAGTISSFYTQQRSQAHSAPCLMNSLTPVPLPVTLDLPPKATMIAVRTADLPPVTSLAA